MSCTLCLIKSSFEVCKYITLLTEPTGRSDSLRKSVHDPAPYKHAAIGHPRDVNLLGVHAEPVQDVVEDDLSVGDVIVTGDPVTRAIGVVAVSTVPEVSTGCVARTPVIPEVKKSKEVFYAQTF